MAIAIVAIPCQDDYIWKISSEKIPHLTIMMLGDHLDNQSSVADFVSHVVDSSMCKFSLRVDHRGLLGDKSADVLFFDQNNPAVGDIENVRSYLLGNADINKAYHSVEQYDEWTPHLTLGFPETPAKPDDRDYPGTYSVVFDKVALWTGDYEGTEFPLKNDSTNGMYMSSLGGNFLQQYGVKGMHWGIRRSSTDSGPKDVEIRAKPGRLVKAKGGQQHSAHEDALRVAISRQKARKSSTDSLSNKELQDLVSRMNLEQQYSRLIATDPRAKSDLEQFLRKAQVVHKTISEVNKFLDTPAGKVAKAALKAKLSRK